MEKPFQLQLFDSIPELSSNPKSIITKEKIGTFTDNMKLPIHRWFRYSAGFSATWIEEVLTQIKPTTILDPFAGSGTACIVADKLGINSYGVEAHPFVYRLAQAKLSWEVSSHDFLAATFEIKNLAKKNKPKLPDQIPALLTKCYIDESLINLFKIKQAYLTIAPTLSEPLKSLIFLTICAILRSSSHVGTAQWQYILPNQRKVKICEPFKALDKQILLMKEDIDWMQSFQDQSHATFIQGDARNLKSIQDQSIDLVITSPPYANNYDYADATRLEMTFWGEVNSWGDLHETVRKFLIRSNSQHVSKDRLNLDDLIQDSLLKPIQDQLIPICQELAKIRKMKSGNKAYHTMIAAYFIDMAAVFYALHRVTKSGSKICLMIGDSAPYGVHVPVEQWLGKLAITAGFRDWSFERIRHRNIKWKNRKHNVPLHEGQLWIER